MSWTDLMDTAWNATQLLYMVCGWPKDSTIDEICEVLKNLM